MGHPSSRQGGFPKSNSHAHFKAHPSMAEQPMIQRTENPIQSAKIEGKQKHKYENHQGCGANLLPPRAMYELHFLLHFLKKLREVFRLTDQTYFVLSNIHARSYIILLRQETLFLPGCTSWLRRTITSRHVRNVTTLFVCWGREGGWGRAGGSSGQPRFRFEKGVFWPEPIAHRRC